MKRKNIFQILKKKHILLSFKRIKKLIYDIKIHPPYGKKTLKKSINLIKEIVDYLYFQLQKL